MSEPQKTHPHDQTDYDQNGQSPTDNSQPDNNQTDNTQPDVATLRQITGAPEINQPLVRPDAFADTEISSERPIWKLPLPKLGFIALALVPVFGVLGLFLVGNRGAQQQATAPPEPLDASDSTEAEGETNELQQAEQEIATLKSKMALDDQAYVKSPPAKPPTSSAQTDSLTEGGESGSTLSPKAEPVSTAAPSVSYRSPPPPIQPSSPAISRAEPVSSVVTTAPLESVDPFEHWRQLVQLGSYGSIPASNLDEPLETELVAGGLERIESGAVPAAYFASTSANSPPATSAIFREESTVETRPNTADNDGPIKPAILEQTAPEISTKTENPSVLTEAESRILEAPFSSDSFSDEQAVGGTNRMQSLIAGGYASGELATPVVLDNEGVEDRFLVVLDDPLMDNAARVAIPAGSIIVVQIDRTSEDGLVQMSATQAIWEEQGFQQELVLPSRTLLIRGNDGEPLMAESYGDSGGDIAAMDTGQFALGAIRRVGELYTRSDSRVQTGDGTTIITESNPSPNILAGALEGGSEAILDSISERNQRAIEKLEQRPRIPYIPAGTSVQVFVNQSMQMPAGF
ncbi:MAG: hypothetical protein AAFN40_16915 [Cyanobacteria bacterium J06560_6]